MLSVRAITRPSSRARRSSCPDDLSPILEGHQVPPVAGVADRPKALPARVVGDLATVAEPGQLSATGEGFGAEEAAGRTRPTPSGRAVVSVGRGSTSGSHRARAGRASLHPSLLPLTPPGPGDPGDHTARSPAYHQYTERVSVRRMENAGLRTPAAEAGSCRRVAPTSRRTGCRRWRGP